MLSCPEHSTQGHKQPADVRKMCETGFQVALDRAGAHQGPGARGQAPRTGKRVPAVQGHVSQWGQRVGAGRVHRRLGLQDSLQEPLGLGQDSLLELGVPWQEGSIDLSSSWARGSS